MNIGLSEIIVIVVEVIVFIGIPVAIVWAGIVMFKRIKSLEARVEQLESNQNMVRKD